jgi:PAS domain S-box-containing protein
MAASGDDTPGGPQPAFQALDAGPRPEKPALGAVETASLLSSLLESSTDAIFAQDIEGRVLTWNRGAELIFGYSSAEAIGQHAFLIVPPVGREEMAAVWERIARGERVPHHECTRFRKDGSEVEVLLSISAIRDGAGRVIALATIAHDLTEQRRLANTLDMTLRSLEDALGEAREQEARSRRFLADAAHQLRTPLAGIRACAEALPRASPPEREQLLATLVGESSRAGRLVAALLRLARVDQGGALLPRPCDVVALCRQEAQRARARAPHLAIGVQASDETATQEPELDPDAVGDILDALLDNALRHAAHEVEVGVAVGERRVELWVRDDGPGLADEVVERAFERFVSLDRRGGSGLGLPIARELARAHGGDLGYEHDAFVVRLPGAEGATAPGGGPRP